MSFLDMNAFAAKMFSIPSEYHYGPNECRHRYNADVHADHWCPECDGPTVWNDANHDMAHCLWCGACSDPDHTVES